MRWSCGNSEGSFSILCLENHHASVISRKTQLTWFLLSRAFTWSHTCLLPAYLLHINKHSVLFSWDSVAVFLLAVCLSYAPRQHRGGDTLYNLWRVPGIYRETQRWRRLWLQWHTHIWWHNPLTSSVAHLCPPLLWVFPALHCDFGSRRTSSSSSLH